MREMKFFFLLLLSCVVVASLAAQTELPTLNRSGVPQPAGKPGGLRVLDWAGYRSALTYTFDDALRSQIENYPKLHATGVRMTFFLTSAHQPNPAWTKIGKDGNELGNHTAHHCHADATGCGWGGYAGSLEAEYDICSDYLKKNYGVSVVWTTATPYGDTGYDEVAKTRFFLNRGVWRGQIAPEDNSDAFNLPIFGAAAGDTAEKFNPAIESAHRSRNWLIFMFHSLGGDGGYAPVDVAEVIKSIDFARAQGDVWIDSMVNVGAYWAGLKAVDAARVKKSGDELTYTWTLPAHFPPHHFVRITVDGGAVRQKGKPVAWNPAGYYEIALDAGEVTVGK